MWRLSVLFGLLLTQPGNFARIVASSEQPKSRFKAIRSFT